MYHSVCPLVGIGTTHPLSRKRVCPPEPKGGWGLPRLRVRGRRVPLRTTGEKARHSVYSVPAQYHANRGGNFKEIELSRLSWAKPAKVPYSWLRFGLASAGYRGLGVYSTVQQYLIMAPNCWAMAWKARWGVDPPLAIIAMQALTLPGPGVLSTTVPDYGTELLGHGMEGEVRGGPTLGHGSHAGPHTTRPWQVRQLSSFGRIAQTKLSTWSKGTINHVKDIVCFAHSIRFSK